MSNLVDTFANRLRYAITIKDIKPIELSKKTGISKTNISCYMSGKYEAKQDGVKLLADALNVNPVWLMGYDVPMEDIYATADEWTNENKYSKIINSDGSISYSTITKIPILGTVKAGYDWLAEENIIDYITLKENIPNIKEYYALKITGDSMLPLLSEGDLVIVHDQDDVESGQTAVVLINGEEATVKKVIKTNDGIELHSMNPYYPVKKFTFEDMKSIPVKIIGRVKEAKIKGAFE